MTTSYQNRIKGNKDEETNLDTWTNILKEYLMTTLVEQLIQHFNNHK